MSTPISVLVIGDLILDQFIRGTVSRISPEAPVPIVNQSSVESFPGGAANVARNLVALEVRVVLMGCVGDDYEGRKLLSLLSDCGVDIDSVQTVRDRPTSHKLRIIGDGQHVVRVDREVVKPLQDQNKTLEAISRHLPTVQGVICSDYNKGFLSPAVLIGTINEASALDKPVIIDPRGSDYTRYTRATVLTPNIKELQIASRRGIDTPLVLDLAAEEILKMTQVDALLVTCGADGVVLYTPDRKTAIPGTNQTVVDASGAGDSLLAAFTWSYLSSQSLIQAAEIGNRAGDISVTKQGTSAVTRDELLPVAGESSITSPKILDLKTALNHAMVARKMNKRIVFTDGCFDLLHGGHMEYLRKARALGDVLIVGLNSDSSVRQFKGEMRPIVPEGQRAQLLAGLSCVDVVVLFEDSTPIRVIEALKPDVLVKGGDYQVHQVVGREVVESIGGRVEIIPLKEGLSTTALIEEIVRRHKMAGN
ncbi:hypothetical protein ASPWEDRAFT_41052 [Aspergillus wentii DTO 134E9]|uniref:D-glycero-beta-D-manno-heptose 1-phosphate adenylyltransferase n=1 Tax=Aspergillus wentii DTO 134E9 TaxID=1073089 RepID=A0A1L9RLJ0_ASPWE|nr:uncharacterized protein ASPWEDRAFT_41052 [Aspergillus wentii DTO 134E9]KAI9929732.1 hypothetical protein MW887_001208 [Aspergillus wentii]OJJ35810.1 hypothetical protein ASPWEDRAFT_41052 [Aspergillus wentii DTO 134E9]